MATEGGRRVRPPRKRGRAAAAAPPGGTAAEGGPSRCVIHNVVSTADFGCTLDLAAIAWYWCGKYNPSAFAAVQLRLDSPRTTALLFSSGNVVCTGARSEYASLLALNIYFYMVSCVHPEAQLRRQRVENIVSSGSLGGGVRIDEMARQAVLVLHSHYEPEVFPGFRLGIKNPAMKILVFTSGNVVLTGGRSRAKIARAWDVLCAVVERFMAGETTGLVSMPHAQVLQQERAARKRRIVAC